MCQECCRMSASLLMMTEPLRAAVASRTLCSWYNPTDAAHTRDEYNRRYIAFLGDGRKSYCDMKAAFGKVKVMLLPSEQQLQLQNTASECCALMQEYWLAQEDMAIKPFRSTQDVCSFFGWLAERLVPLDSGQKSFVKAQQHVAALVEYQGFVSWNYSGDPYLKKLKNDIAHKQMTQIHITRPATNRSKFYLSMPQIQDLADKGWQARADDGILLQQFVATEIQAMTRPGHSLDTCRVNVKLTNPAEEELTSVFGTVRFSEMGTAGRFHKLRSKAVSFSYEIGTLKAISLDPHAAHGARLVHDYLRLNDLSCPDGRQGGLAEMIKRGTTGTTMYSCPLLLYLFWFLFV